mmetsp:Transcript_43755/g.116895  ORF Transcript_43755/g.116895 Transcript_43755/m.116895 type:complete len:86 (-) Transcript_43755:202-459(-)
MVCRMFMVFSLDSIRRSVFVENSECSGLILLIFFFLEQFVTLKSEKAATYQLAQIANATNAGNGALGTDVVFISPASIQKKQEFH